MIFIDGALGPLAILSYPIQFKRRKKKKKKFVVDKYEKKWLGICVYGVFIN